MPMYDGVSCGFLRYDKRARKYEFTDAGLSELKNLIEVGCTPGEVADFFVVDEEFILAAVAADGQAHDVFRHATALFKRTLRQAQLHLSPKSASMARHLGHHALGQPVDPTPREEGLERRVVGTMPDWGSSPDDWTAKFKPKDQGGSTIDKLNRMRIEQERGEAEQDEVEAESESEGSSE